MGEKNRPGRTGSIRGTVFAGFSNACESWTEHTAAAPLPEGREIAREIGAPSQGAPCAPLARASARTSRTRSAGASAGIGNTEQQWEQLADEDLAIMRALSYLVGVSFLAVACAGDDDASGAD